LSVQDQDRDLAERIADRDEKAADLFHELHTEALLAAARNNGLAPEDCQDAVQEVLVTAIQQIRTGRFRGESSVSTWLQAILRHKILDYWRVYFRRDARLVPIESLTSLSPIKSSSVCANDLDADLQVREVLAGLPDDLRSILLLNETEGWTIAEIAAMMKMRPNTVGRKLAEAKEMFRQKILAVVVRGAKALPPGEDKR
jgi:RNA polymerase sigma-70 factor (ECF subfamily)